MVYGAAVIVQRAAAFVLLPLYTQRLSPADYGALQMLQVTLDVAAIALSAGTLAGVMRFFFKANDEPERRSVFTTAFWLMLAFNALAALLLLAFAPALAERVIDRPDGAHLVRLQAASFAAEPLGQVAMLQLQARGRAAAYSTLSVVRLLMQISFNVFFLVVLERGVEGVLLSTLITNLLLGTALAGWQLSSGWRPNLGVARDLMRFGLPYRVTTAGTFILTFADRYFLEARHDLAEVGLYGLAYQFGFLLIVASSAPFLQAWNPERFRLASRPREERDAAYDEGLRWFSIVVVSAALGLCLFAQPLLAVMASASYAGAARLVPIIVAAYVLQAFTDAAELGIQISERTRYATLATWAAVVVVLIGYVTLIPPFGGLGAALATLAGFAVRFGFTWRFAQQLWPIRLRYAPHLRLLALATVTAAAVEWIRPPETMSSMLLGAGAFALFALATLFGVVSRDERRAALAFLRARRTSGAAPR